jgi:hypothetical protein
MVAREVRATRPQRPQQVPYPIARAGLRLFRVGEICAQGFTNHVRTTAPGSSNDAKEIAGEVVRNSYYELLGHVVQM